MVGTPSPLDALLPPAKSSIEERRDCSLDVCGAKDGFISSLRSKESKSGSPPSMVSVLCASLVLSGLAPNMPGSDILCIPEVVLLPPKRDCIRSAIFYLLRLSLPKFHG